MASHFSHPIANESQQNFLNTLEKAKSVPESTFHPLAPSPQRQCSIITIEAFTNYNTKITLHALLDPHASLSTIVKSKELETQLPISLREYVIPSGASVSSRPIGMIKLKWHFCSAAKTYADNFTIIGDDQGTCVDGDIEVVVGADSKYHLGRSEDGRTDETGTGNEDDRIAVLGLKPLSKKDKEDQDERGKKREAERREETRKQEEKEKEKERKGQEAANRKK